MDSSCEFFDRLYLGYEAECLVSSQLFARKLEAFRLPADFGYDLVVSNALAVIRSDHARCSPFPWLLQVKSRRVDTSQMIPAPNGRLQLSVSFTISEPDWISLQNTANGYLVLVMIIAGEMPWGQLPSAERKPSMLATRHDAFVWFSSSQLRYLAPFVGRDARGAVNLNILYRSRPTGRIREHFEKVAQFAPQSVQDEVRKLRTRLPERGEVPMRSGDYFVISDGRGNERRLLDHNLALRLLGTLNGQSLSADGEPFVPKDECDGERRTRSHDTGRSQ